MKIDGYSEPILEKELEVHETRESGRHIEIDKEIEIMRFSFTPCGGSKQPKFFHPKCVKFTCKVLNGDDE